MKRHFRKLLTGAMTAAMVFSLAVPALATITDPKDAEVEFTANTGPDAFKFEGGAPALDFGSHTLSLDDMWYDEASSSNIVLAVKDGRGTGVGWRVTAKLSDFTGVTVATRKLPNAEIVFQDPTQTRVNDGGSVAPVGGSVTLPAGGSAAELFWKAQDVAGTNPNGAGTGTTTLTWLPYSAGTGENTTKPAAASGHPIFLFVDGGTAMADTYKATIDWVLHNTPV